MASGATAATAAAAAAVAVIVLPLHLLTWSYILNLGLDGGHVEGEESGMKS